MSKLKTDYVDDIFDGKRRYKINDNGDGTVSFQDVTVYTTEGSEYGSDDVNTANTEINLLNDNLIWNEPLIESNSNYILEFENWSTKINSLLFCNFVIGDDTPATLKINDEEIYSIVNSLGELIIGSELEGICLLQFDGEKWVIFSSDSDKNYIESSDESWKNIISTDEDGNRLTLDKYNQLKESSQLSPGTIYDIQDGIEQNKFGYVNVSLNSNFTFEDANQVVIPFDSIIANIGNMFEMQNDGSIKILKNCNIAEITLSFYWLSRTAGRKTINIFKNGTDIINSQRAVDISVTGDSRFPVTVVLSTQLLENDIIDVRATAADNDVFSNYCAFIIKTIEI